MSIEFPVVFIGTTWFDFPVVVAWIATYTISIILLLAFWAWAKKRY